VRIPNLSSDLTDLVRHLVTGLVKHPEALEVRVLDGDPTLYEIRVDPEDQGRIIGREGRTIRALRMVVGAAARKAGGSATVEVAE
jgi:predicted RNA-binding protein YlqC (UPF0109 family)